MRSCKNWLKNHKTLVYGVCFCFFLLGVQESLFAQVESAAPARPSKIDSVLNSPNPFEQQDFLNLHQQLKILGLMTLLGFIPFILVMMTSFTRITIIFHFLRQALAIQQVPSNQLVIGLSLILTGFVMRPVIDQIESQGITPYLKGEFKNYPEVKMGVKGEDFILLERCWNPLREFMLLHTREKDMMLFLDIAKIQLPEIDPTDPLETQGKADGTGPSYDLNAIPWHVLVPSFVLSELRVAFMMGFLLFIPFLVIDMVVSSVLMSMGMMMLPPVMISTPFKLLLFIVIDGWSLIIQQIVRGFYPS